MYWRSGDCAYDPWAYNVLLCLGAAYIAYIGWGLLNLAQHPGTGRPIAKDWEIFQEKVRQNHSQGCADFL